MVVLVAGSVVTAVTLWRLPPMTVLRSVQRLPAIPWPSRDLAVAGLVVLTFLSVEARSWLLGSLVSGGVVAIALLTVVAGGLLLFLVNSLAQCGRPWSAQPRHYKPIAAIAALTMATSLGALNHCNFERALDRSLSAEAFFAIDIQDHQLADFIRVMDDMAIPPASGEAY